MSDKLEKLDGILSGYPSVLVAYSGGVDSSFLLHRATRVLGALKCTGVIADSPSLPRAELSAALAVAAQFGAKVEVVRTAEFENPSYVANPPNRCFFCKSELFAAMERLAYLKGVAALAYGENADDIHHDRPGRGAAPAFRVTAPLREAGLAKPEIRAAARAAGLPVAEKPASPCLSSRIPHGVPVTANTLRQIEQGEEILRQMGFRIFRLRHHGPVARLEFGADEIGRYEQPSTKNEIEARLRSLGYAAIERAEHPYGHRNAAASPVNYL